MSDRPGFPEPSPDVADPGTLTLRHLEHLRGAAVAKVASLPPSEHRRSRVASGWTPLELLWHLLHVERRWIVWGFLGQAVDDPWGDQGPDATGTWQVPDEVSLAQIEADLAEQAELTRRAVGEHTWDERAAPGGRFAVGSCPTLGSICFHLLQEYARHLGHLDVSVELAGGDVGE